MLPLGETQTKKRYLNRIYLSVLNCSIGAVRAICYLLPQEEPRVRTQRKSVVFDTVTLEALFLHANEAKL